MIVIQCPGCNSPKDLKVVLEDSSPTKIARCFGCGLRIALVITMDYQLEDRCDPKTLESA